MTDTQRLWTEVALRDLTAAGKDSIVRNVSEIKAATVEASRASGELGGKGAKEVDKIAASLGGVAKIAAGVFTGIKVADLTKDLAAFHTATMDNVAGLGSLADRYGITTDQLQAYQAAARPANVTAEELNKTLGTFNTNVGQARDGNKAALDSFEKLGIKIFDAQGNLRPMPDLLNETARSLLLIENSSTRASIGTGLLGEKGARLNPLLRELATPINGLVEAGRSMGVIVDREIIDKLDRAKNASEAAQQQLTALYATVAAPIHAQGMEYLAVLTSDLTRRIREARGSWLEMMGSILSDNGKVAPNTMGGLKRLVDVPDAQRAADLAAAREKLARLNTELASPNAQGRQDMVRADIAATVAAIGALEAADRKAAVEAQNLAAAQRLTGDGLPAKDGFKTAGVGNNPKPTGSGGDKRDRIGEAVAQLKGEVAAAQGAFDALRAGAKIPLEDLEREVELRKRIADEIAKLGKYDPKDPRVEEIKTLVRAHEELETKIKQRSAAMKDAVEIERRMGDGSAYLAAETKRLNEALDTGRLSYGGYSLAMKEASEKAEDMRLKQLGLQGGFEGFFAGLQNAANQATRANTAFAAGGRGYEMIVANMGAATTALATRSKLDFGQIAMGWANMLADMSMRWAASEIFGLLGFGGAGAGGGAGGIFSNLFGGGSGYVPPVTATTNTIPDIGTLVGNLGFAAEGGDISGPTVVGEREPELFVPKVPGNVLNPRQLQALGVTGGRGGGGRGGRAETAGGRLDIYVHENTEMLRLEIDNRSSANVARAAPAIVKAATDRSRSEVVPTVAKHQAETGGDWRV